MATLTLSTTLERTPVLIQAGERYCLKARAMLKDP